MANYKLVHLAQMWYSLKESKNYNVRVGTKHRAHKSEKESVAPSLPTKGGEKHSHPSSVLLPITILTVSMSAIRNERN